MAGTNRECRCRSCDRRARSLQNETGVTLIAACAVLAKSCDDPAAFEKCGRHCRTSSAHGSYFAATAECEFLPSAKMGETCGCTMQEPSW